MTCSCGWYSRCPFLCDAEAILWRKHVATPFWLLEPSESQILQAEHQKDADEKERHS